MIMPRVSTLIRMHNSERYLSQAINSILGQAFRDFELLLLDNGSDSKALTIAFDAAEKDARVSVVKGHPQGLVHGLNIGLQTARGEFVAILDADDVAAPDRFAKQVSFLDAHPECCAVGSHAMRIDPDGLPINYWLVPQNHAEIDSLLMTGLGGGMLHPSVMMRAAALRKIGGYREKFEWGAEDYDVFLRLAEIGKLANLPEVLLQYRLHIKKVTVTHNDEQLPNTKRAWEDARVRRGITGALQFQQYEHGSLSEEELMWTWTRSAFAGGNYKTARKYAFRLLQRRPTDLKCWILLGAACVGPVAYHIKRVVPYRVGPYRSMPDKPW